jgi:hypothetical protein
VHCTEKQLVLDDIDSSGTRSDRREAIRGMLGMALGLLSSSGISGCQSNRLSNGAASLGLPQGHPATSWEEYRFRAAQRMVAANPDRTYMGPVPEPLLAIPALEIEVDADGGIERIEVKRVPSQAQDTIQLAIDAVKRAAPFGNARQLPKPWKFTEIFLFDDGRKFKPQSLDQ